VIQDLDGLGTPQVIPDEHVVRDRRSLVWLASLLTSGITRGTQQGIVEAGNLSTILAHASRLVAHADRVSHSRVHTSGRKSHADGGGLSR
jgi:hypothetical protein